MSKPLELTIYPPRAKQPLPFDPDWQGWDAWREWKRLHDREFQQCRATRFTDAELAAEWWQEVEEHTRTAAQVLYEKSALGNRYVTDHFREVRTRCETLHRFATSPHYFEADQ